MTLTRRHTLIAGATLPFAAAATPPAPARAQAAPAEGAPHRVFTLGGFRVVTLLAGSRVSENPQETFGMNAPAEAFAALSEENFIPADRWRNGFAPTLVDTGAERILFDTGLDAAGITAALASAGYAPADITHVVLTHMHGDHIGGLSAEDGTATFAGAAYLAGRAEFDAWAAAGNEGFEAKVRPLADRFAFLEDGGTVRSGITAVAAPGHTPGHMAFMVEDGGQRVLLTADTVNHYVWSLARPDWEVRFDADKTQAAATRRRLLGMAAAERFPIIGYHMPFPAMGFVAAEGEGFRWVPVSYQFG